MVKKPRRPVNRSATRRAQAPALVVLPPAPPAPDPEDVDDDQALNDDDGDGGDDARRRAILLREIRRVDAALVRAQERRVQLARQLHDEAGYSWDTIARLAGGSVSGESLRRWARS